MTQGHNSQHLDQRLDACDPPCPQERFASPTAHDALVHAWDLIKLLIAKFWRPLQLHALPGIPQWRMYDFLDWLRPLELMLRRLILLEALAIAPGLPEPAPMRARTAAKPKSAPTPDPDHPETWRVRFLSLKLIQHGSRPRRPAPPRPKMSRRDRRPRVTLRDRTDLRDTKALARRLEAAIRVVSDPMPWIRRLALRIRRNGAPDPAKLAKPQNVRVARPVPTLDALGAELRLGPVPRHDSL
jgi:hypothetical protein